MTLIAGKMHVFGNNIDTDQICPGYCLELTDPKEIGAHCLEGADARFAKEFVRGGIVVAGTNFGCGSSREHAAIALSSIGVGAVVAESFARIFYRNGINMGLLLITCSRIGEIAAEGDVLEIHTESWQVENKTTGESRACEPISEYAWKLFEAGGIKKLICSE